MNKTQTPRQVLNLPAGYFGMVLGTIGMGFAWRYASTLWPVSRSIGDGLVTLAMAMWGLLSMAFISRAIRFPASVLREMRHPVSSSFVSLFPATTLLVAIGLAPWCRPRALGLIKLLATVGRYNPGVVASRGWFPRHSPPLCQAA